MASYGRVIGGHYLNATVSPGIGSQLVVQVGLKRRKLSEEQVTAWEEIVSESKSGTVSAVGQAVAGVVLPRFMSKAASAAVGATLDTTMRPPRTVRIDWADGKQSLIKLPDKLFTHLALVLKSRQTAIVEPTSAAVEGDPAPVDSLSVTEQALTHLSGLLKDRLPMPVMRTPEVLASTLAAEPDVTEQLTKLAALRDAGIVTEDEFATKKSELLGRL